MKYAFLIAGTETGVGKTTIVMSLLKYFKNKKYRVQSFKCGPDFIDPIVHEKINGRPCINLDSVLMSEGHIKYLVNKYSYDADIVIVEGVMGMFDGSGKGMIGSSSHISQILSIPVILVIDGARLAKTVGAILYGFKYYDPLAELRAVIFNHVNSEKHYELLREAAEEVNVKPLGYIGDQNKIKLDERYLGLNFDTMKDSVSEYYKDLLNNICIDDLLEVSTNYFQEKTVNIAEKNKSYLIAIANDEAFKFTYKENLEVLKNFADLTFFSPLNEKSIPDADLIYLPGGYPENYLEKLDKSDFYSNIKGLFKKNKVIVAECGGMMLLGKSINHNDNIYKTAGIFDYTIDFRERLSISYVDINGKGDFKGLRVKGHEFHLSSVKINKDQYSNLFEVKKIDGSLHKGIFFKKRCFASYYHIYWAEKKSFIKRLLMYHA